MSVVNNLIVEIDSAYNNEKELSGGQSIILNSTIEDVEFVNRVATVTEAPDFTILKAGDKVVVHHNIFRLRNGIKGGQMESNYFIKDNKYFVPLTEVFMFKRDDSDWEAIDPYCFVEPIVKEKKEVFFDLSIDEDSYKGRLHQKGIIRYPNKALRAQGVKSGDMIMFSEYSEYEFVLDNVLYYKMATKDIIAVI
tara:strand:+ start:2261 stop:2842 length:582 start_codon:yes stop_codon:yes gene_type:complete